MNGNGNGTNSLATVETTIAVVDALRELNGARISRLATHLDLPRSTVYRHLRTLYDHGYVAKEGDTYKIGLRFLDVGEYTRHSIEGFRKMKRAVEDIAAETGDRCQFVVKEHGRGVYVYVASGESDEDLAELRVGRRMFLHSTASGKSILAHLPEDRIEEIIEMWGLPGQTPHTVTTKEALFETLDRVREQGYAFNRGGNVDGLRAVGAPVRGPGPGVVGSISISGPAYRMQGDRYERDLPELLVERVEKLEREIEADRS